MLKLATILDNPGEPSAETRYRDPQRLAQLGYNGLVIYETTGLSGLDSADSAGAGEMRRWVAQQYDLMRQRIEAARKAGLDVFIFYDVLSLARTTVEKDAAAYTCRRRPTSLCPASDAALERSGRALENLLRQLGDVQGVVLRIGDNDAARLPYLVGNDIYTPHCPRCSQLGRADRIINVVTHFHDRIVQRLGRRLIVRAWNVRPNGLHDSVDVCRRVVERLPGDASDDRMVLSFKFTQTDFWRYQQWNPASLVCDRRPILYELQCQREFEGKGGIPDWQVPLWRDGMPEVAARAQGPLGLAQAVQQINFAGLWAWVRGGGWGGPFVANETWIDANAFAVPLLAETPAAQPAELAHSWIAQRLGQSEPEIVQAVLNILEHSPQFVLKGFYIGPFAQQKADPWHPNADWIQDDLVDAQAAWRMIQRLPDADLDEVVAEKQQAVEQVSEDRATLHRLITERNRGALEPLLHTLMYTESLFEALRDLLAGLIAYRRYLRQRDASTTETCRQRLTAAQSNWSQHTQRHGSLPGAATAFREAHFWELTQQILAELA